MSANFASPYMKDNKQCYYIRLRVTKPELSVPYLFLQTRFLCRKSFSEPSYRFQKYQYYTYQEDDQNYRHFYKVDKVLIRLHINLQCIRIDSKTVRNQCTDYKCQKEYKEENSIIQYCTTTFIGQFLIRYTINEIERTQHTRQKNTASPRITFQILVNASSPCHPFPQ